MKTARILPILLSLFCGLSGYGATVTGPLLEIFGDASSAERVRFVPPAGGTIINSTNTVLDYARGATVTNGNFSAYLVGGFYDCYFYPATQKPIRILVPVNDTNSYTFAQVSQLAMNAMLNAGVSITVSNDLSGASSLIDTYSNNAASTFVPLAGGTLTGPLTNVTADVRATGSKLSLKTGASTSLDFIRESGQVLVTNTSNGDSMTMLNSGFAYKNSGVTIASLDTSAGTSYGGIFRGVFNGDGSLLTALNASQLLSGTIPLAVLPTNQTNDLNTGLSSRIQGATNDLSNVLLPRITNSTPLVWGQRTNLWPLFLGASYTDTNSANGYGFHTMWLYTNYMIPNETSVTFSNYGAWGQNNYDKSNEFFTVVHPFIVNSAKSTNFATISTGEAPQNDYNQTELNGAGLMTTPTPEQSFSYYTSVVTRIVLDYTVTNSFTNFAIISHLVHPMAQQETPARALWRNKYNELVLGFNPGGFVKAWMNWGKFMNQPANTNMFRASDFTHPTLAASTNATLEFANIFGHILNGRPVPLPASAWSGAAPEWNLQSSNVFAQKLGGSNITVFPTVANTVALDIYEQGAGFGFPFLYRMTYGNNSGLLTNRYQLRVVFTGSGVNAQYQMLEYVPGLAFTANKELQRLYANGNTEFAGMLTGTNGLYFPQGTNTAPTAAIIGGTVGSVTNYLQKNVGGVLMLYWSDGTTLYSKQIGP